MDANSIKEELLHKPNDRSKEDGAEGMEKALKESGTLSGLGFTEKQEQFIAMLVKSVYIKGYNDGITHMLGKEPMSKADIVKSLKEE